MIKVIYIGRLGNQLFEYAFGRILAEDMGYNLEAKYVEGFPATGDTVEGDIVWNNRMDLRGQDVDLEEIHSRKGKTGIKVCGWFQQYRYYKPHRDKIRGWFNRTRPAPAYDLTPDDVVLHVRRTQKGGVDYTYPYKILDDCISTGHHSQMTLDDTVRDHLRMSGIVNQKMFDASTDLMPFEWYEDILDSMSFNRLYICTDMPNDPYLKYFDKYDPIMARGSELQDFNLLRSANRIICCNSTFSWWAAWLSDAREIHLPRVFYGTWSCKDVDLVVDDLPHYKVSDVYAKGRFF